MNRKQKRIYVTDIPIIEVILSLISSWWAIVFLNSPNIFAEYPDTYSTFANLAPISYWAGLFIVAAVVKIIGIILQVRWLRRIGLLLSAVVYGLIAYCYFIGIGWFSIGFGTFFSISVMALWGMREVDRTHG